jgi:hypothetical protein
LLCTELSIKFLKIALLRPLINLFNPKNIFHISRWPPEILVSFNEDYYRTGWQGSTEYQVKTFGEWQGCLPQASTYFFISKHNFISCLLTLDCRAPKFLPRNLLVHEAYIALQCLNCQSRT